ncbi:hypothetical protein C8F04DRAFT_1260875 [Mycena alexandri]|uniref:C2H2-type domain-containing protein n=1 Tax=Mycena alexandri TaxID=1745969 RepID=A0AAD6WZT9_9AGAR|nr:hypothetical protein C8F04DRAFT_1260875 [Mycena alexandri]
MPHGQSYTCPDCLFICTSSGGLTRHQNTKHRKFTPASEVEDENTFDSQYHGNLNALPCNAQGVYLPEFVGPPPRPPPPPDGQSPEAWNPFDERVEFDFAHFHFVQAQSSE